MIICPSCRSQEMNGALFCSECGGDLQAPAVPTLGLEKGVAPAPTRNAATSAVDTLPPPPPPKPRAAPGPVSQQPPARRVVNEEPLRQDLRIMILNSGRLIECPDKDNIIIGRSDAVTGDRADIDLSPDNALGLGVSRRHACITFRGQQPYLTDLGSLNRTWLNRQIIMRGQPYELKDGDEIRLGNAILKVIHNP